MTSITHDVVDRRSSRTAVVALVVGAILAGITLNVDNGSWQFYVAGFALAATWVTAYVIAPTRPRPDRRRTRDAGLGVLVGCAMFGVFVAGSWVMHRLHVFDGEVDDLLATADSVALGWALAVAGVNAVAEELFFRGTLIDAARRHFAYAAGIVPYVFSAVPSGNIALVIAAAVMGTAFTVLRMRTGALAASITTHLVWSALMILAFPR
jgi:membrane protease YdiL (CAAX protease family)